MIVAVTLLLELLIAATVAARQMRKRFRSPRASIAAFDAAMAALEPVAAHNRETLANVFALDEHRIRRTARSSARARADHRAVTPKS